MVEIRLKDGQTGYDAVAEYVKIYWARNFVTTVIVSAAVSYNGDNYVRLNDVASPTDSFDVEFLHDWWSGEKYIRVYGIKKVSEIRISGGLYEKKQVP